MNTPPKKTTPNTTIASQKFAWQNATPRRPVAPPVYRPQSLPKVLQTKKSMAQIRPVDQARRPLAPPVYRPEQKKIVQPKILSSQRKPLLPPPVYRPAKQRVAQPKIATVAHAHTPLKAQPFNRSQVNQVKARPTTPATRPLRQPSVKSTAAPSVLQRATRSVIQRLVVKLGKDDSSVKNADALVEHGGVDASLRWPEELDGLMLAQLGPNETLHIVAHGDGRGHIEGLGPSQFVEGLMEHGLDPQKHKGTIRLVSCYSGTQFGADFKFTEAFAAALRRCGFGNAVIGFDGAVTVRPNGKIGVAPRREYEMLDNVVKTLQDQLDAEAKRQREELREVLADRRPPLTAEERQSRRDYVQGISQVQHLRKSEREALFEDQKMGKNVSFIVSVRGTPAEIMKRQAALDVEAIRRYLHDSTQ